MKNFKQLSLLLLSLAFVLNQLPAATIHTIPSNETGNIDYPAAKVEGYFLEKGIGEMSLENFLALTPKSYRKQTGQKLCMKERLVLKFAQKNIKRQLKKGQPLDEVIDLDKEKSQFNWGAFALGFFLGLIGVLIVVIVFKDKKAWTSALVGLGLAVGLILLIATIGRANQV